MHVNAAAAEARDAAAMMRWFGVYLIAAWLVLATSGQLFGGWVHVLPLLVLLAVATRVTLALVTRD